MIWYTSDLHLGHKKIIELCNRPFKDVDEMNEQIVKRWNRLVDPNDKVFVLGDLAMGNIKDSMAIASTLQGEKYLVPGNHDRCWSGNKKIRTQDINIYTDAGFTILAEDIVSMKGYRLCHFPYSGDSQYEDRYVEFRPRRDKSDKILLHGHVHNEWRIRNNQINVGVDVWNYYPVSEHIINRLFFLEVYG